MAEMFVLVVALVCMSMSICRGDLQADPKDCHPQFMSLVSCFQFVQGNDKTPTQDCCANLKTVQQSAPKCLYIVIRDNSLRLGFSLNETLALEMPSICKVNANISECPALLHISPSSPEAKKFDPDNTLLPNGKPLNGEHHKRRFTPATCGISAGIFAATTVIIIIVIYQRVKRKRREQRDEEGKDIKAYMDPHDSRPPSVENFLHGESPTRYTYAQIRRYTNNFSDKLGQGGFGTVYKGKLPNECLVAVKILDKSEHNRKQFMNEVATVGRIHHMHLVRLLGYCFQGSERALVYEYMVNGSLDKYIHGNDQTALDWKQLYSIALGTARGIAYLHDACRSRILHCDIKPHNVLLDANFSPKVGDFGLAKLTDREESHVSMTGARGKPGYVAPEVWSKNYGPISVKSDVYSYGMLVMEMVGGRKNFDMEETRSSRFYYPEWAFKQVEMGEFAKLRGGNIANEEDESMAKKLSLLGLWCIQYIPSQRPSMSQVIQILEGTVNITIPPQPFPQSVETSIQTSASTESSSSIIS